MLIVFLGIFLNRNKTSGGTQSVQAIKDILLLIRVTVVSIPVCGERLSDATKSTRAASPSNLDLSTIRLNSRESLPTLARRSFASFASSTIRRARLMVLNCGSACMSAHTSKQKVADFLLHGWPRKSTSIAGLICSKLVADIGGTASVIKEPCIWIYVCN